MGLQDLNQKYTIERYCTKIEVAEGLHTNLIEPFWKQIVDFRKLYSRTLPIYDASHYYYTLTNVDSVGQKSHSIDDKMTRYVMGFGKFGGQSIARKTLTKEMLKSSLKSIAKLNKIDASEITLNNIVEHNNVDESYSLLVKYLKCLEELYKSSYDNIGEEFLAKYYAILRGQEDNLTSFYRINNNDTVSSKVLIDREYDDGVPAHLIDTMMSDLIEFLLDSSTSMTTRLISIFFMFNYIKPFEEFNLEMACIVAKRLIGTTDIGGTSIYIPLENFVTDHDFFNDIFKEVQKSNDFTYAYLRGADLLENSFVTVIDRIIQVNAHALDLVNKIGDDPVKIKKEFGYDAPDEVKTEVVEEVVKVVKQPKVEIIEEIHSEKELKAKEMDMLESDPFVKKGQAHFYVRHCTKGKFYTIQQYKKAEGCVYETARTSMDNLALQGYYRKEQIKNKFVYTPIDKE